MSTTSEDEIGQDVDRLIRSALMAAGQIREHAARNLQSNAWAQQQQMASAVAEHKEHTALVYDRVRREEFWQQASSEQVADLTTFTSAIAPHDARGREAHDVMREHLRSRYGVDLDAIAAAHADPADRRNALVHALDDHKATIREDADARAELTPAQRPEERTAATQPQQSGAPRTPDAGLPQPAAAADTQSTGRRPDAAAPTKVPTATGPRAGKSSGYARVTDRELAGATPAAAKARRQAATSFPQPANAALRTARESGRPRPVPVGAQRGREAAQELTR